MRSTVSYSQDKWVFHVLVRGGLNFVVVAGSELGRRIPFAFLEDVYTRFRKTYTEDQVLSALAYAYKNEFGRVLRQQMEFFKSDNPEADNINRVKEEINQVKNVMVQNIDKVRSYLTQSLWLSCLARWKGGGQEIYVHQRGNSTMRSEIFGEKRISLYFHIIGTWGTCNCY